MKDNVILGKLLKISKAIMIILTLILIVLTIGVSKMYSTETVKENTETTSEESEYNTDYDVSMFEEITAKDIKTKTKKDTQVVYIGRESCGWCAAFLPALWEAQDEYDYKTLYIDLAKIIDFSNGSMLDQGAYDTLSSLKGEGYESYMEENLGATPMVLIIKDNKIIGASTGYSEYEAFETVLNDAGIK